jgi:hypothetical protein
MDNANEPDLYLSVVNPFLGRKSKLSWCPRWKAGFRSFPADGKPTSRFPSALDVALYEIINYKLRIPREHIQDRNSLIARQPSAQLYGEPPGAGTVTSKAKEGCIAVKTAKESPSQSGASPGLGPWVGCRVVERASPPYDL